MSPRSLRIAAYGAGALALFALAIGLAGYPADLFKKWLLVACLAMGFHFLFGVSGQIAFSHGVFYGLGAYLVILLSVKAGFPLPLAILATLAIAVIVAVLVALPTIRLEGFYLALATMALAQLFEVMLVQGGSLTGGADGLYGFSDRTIAGIAMTGANYAVILVCLFLFTFWVIARMNASRFGRQCRAVRDNPVAAAAMGIDAVKVRVAAFVVTSALASLTGIGYAFLDNYVNPYVFGLEIAFLVFFMVIIGGSDSLFGALLGATLLFLAPEAIGAVVDKGHKLLFGVLMVLAVIYRPRGLVSLLQGVTARVRRRRPVATAAP